MKIESPYRCDGCGIAKGEANHWLLGINMTTLCDVITVTGGPSLVGYAIVQWDLNLVDDAQLKPHHLCGEKCALTKQAEYLRR